MTSFSVAIMGVPERRALRKRVVERLGELGTKAVEVVDFGHNGPVPTSLRAWGYRDPKATHHLLLQDDAWPCRDFERVLLRVLAAAPEAILSLFTLKPDLRRHHHMDRHFVNTQEASGVGLVMPVAWVDEYLAWTDAYWAEQWHPGDDARVEFFALDAGHPFLITVPNIIDHVDDGRSWQNHPPSRRSPVYDEDIVDHRDVWELPAEIENLRPNIPTNYLQMFAKFKRGELWAELPPAPRG